MENSDLSSSPSSAVSIFSRVVKNSASMLYVGEVRRDENTLVDVGF